MQDTGEPAILIQGTVAKHLKVLKRVLLRRVSIIQAVHQAAAGHGFLNRSIYARGFGKVGCLKNRRRNIDHVRELTANLALTVDTVRPVNDHAISGAAKVRGHLLGPLKRCIKGHRPTR